MHLFIGTYTRERSSIPGVCGKGVVCIEVEPEQRRWRLAAEPCALVDPTYLAWADDGRVLMSVADGGKLPQRLVALRLGEDGVSLTEQSSAETHGQSSCHIVALQGGGFAVASYQNACLDTYQVDGRGQVQPESYYRYEGSSVHPRQKEPHAHHACLSPDERWLYVCDLGADCLWKHPIDPQTHAVGPVAEKIATPAGEGPRHMVFDAQARRAYVIAELTGRLLVYDWLPEAEGGLRFVAAVEGLPVDFNGMASGAAIVRHPSGKAILASQRQHNSIAFFVVDASAGAAGVRLVKNLPCAGSEPRDFTVDASGRWLFVANQNSASVTVFELEPDTGLPLRGEPDFTIDVGTPVCVLARG